MSGVRDDRHSHQRPEHASHQQQQPRRQCTCAHPYTSSNQVGPWGCMTGMAACSQETNIKNLILIKPASGMRGIPRKISARPSRLGCSVTSSVLCMHRMGRQLFYIARAIIDRLDLFTLLHDTQRIRAIVRQRHRRKTPPSRGDAKKPSRRSPSPSLQKAPAEAGRPR